MLCRAVNRSSQTGARSNLFALALFASAAVAACGHARGGEGSTVPGATADDRDRTGARGQGASEADDRAGRSPDEGRERAEARAGDRGSAGAERGEREREERDEAAYELDPMMIEVDPETGEADVYDARSLLDAGNAALGADRPRRAMAYYDRILSRFPGARVEPIARYNLGLALEGLGDYDGAVERYLELAEDDGAGRYAIDAAIRAGAVSAEVGQWAEAAEILEELLARDDLTPSDRVEGHARLGYVLYEERSDPDAEDVLQEGLRLADELGPGEPLETSYYVAMSHFYMGMIARRQFAEIPLRLPDDQLERDIEAKADLVLLAHDRFSRAIELGGPRWGTAAGYELGAMQEEFWREIVTAPIPPYLSPDQVEIYKEEVHAHAVEFLERALSLYGQTAELAEAHRTSTRWSRAAQARASAVAELLARVEAGERVDPEVDAPAAGALAPEDEDWDVATYTPSRTEL